MGKTLCSLLLLATVLSYGRCKSVNPRNTGVGSGASAGEKSEELFPPVAATTTSAPTDPPNTNTNVDPARLAELYKALGCLNVGSSATGINDNSINYIDFENGSPSSQGEQHRINCSVLLPACHDRVDLVFLLDASGSVELANFNKEKDFIAQSISRFFISPKDAQVSVVTFSNQPVNAFNLNQYQNKASIVAGVNQIPYVAGGTYTSSALAYVRENSFTPGAGDRPDARNVLVVMTDGKSTDPMQTVLEAAKLKQSNITTIVLGIGSGVDQKELNTIASAPSYVLNVDDFDALRHVYGNIHEISCIIDQTTTPMPTTTPIPTTTQEPKTQEPSTKEPTTQEPTTMEPTTMEPATQEPSTPVPTPVVCRDKADLVYLLDSSGSVGIGNFKKEQNFIAQSLSRFVIGPNDTQVSVAMFSNEPVSAFNLSDYQDKASIVNAVNNMTYIAGGTYTSSALAFVRDISFSSEAGGRSDVRNVLVVITDGKSTDPAQTIKEAKTLHGTNISVIAVGIGSGVDKNELNVIATDPQYVLNVDDFDALIKIYGSVHELACKIINNVGAGTGSSVGKVTTAKPSGAGTTAATMGSGTTSSSGGVSGGVSSGTGGTGTGTGGGPSNGPSNGGSTAGSGSTSIPVTATSGGLTPDTLTPDNFTDYNHTGRDCRDLINCRPYPKERICPTNSSYFPWANVRCKAYCGICIVNTPPPPCVNKISNCNEYDADLCTNPLYRLFREDNCQLFCGLCKTADAGASQPPPNRRDDEEKDIFFL